MEMEKPASKSTFPVRSANPMAAMLQGVILQMDSAAQVRQSLALAYWPRAVGPQAAAATEVETVRDGVLFVRTKSSVWSHELTLHKTRILTNLNRMLGGKVIEEVVFRAQGVKRVEETLLPDVPEPEELNAVVLTPEEKIALRTRLEQLHTVEHERARKALAVRMTREAKLRHWRLERGWHVCVRCEALHKTEERICPLCLIALRSKK